MMSESGRSIGETITVLAIMGVLSVVGIACYQYAINKEKANEIVHNGRIIYTLMQGISTPVASDWAISNEFENFSYPIYKKYDKALKPYIKVMNIEKSICAHLLNMASNKNLIFYNENEEDLFNSCMESNNIIFSFDDTGKIAQCIKTTDCDLENITFNGFCNEQNQCQECDSLSTPNSDRSACQCDSDIAVSCSNYESQWCCEKDKLCSDTTGQCEDDFICKASYTTETVDNTCHYTYTQTTTNNTCHCTFTIDPDTNVVSMTKDPNHQCSGEKYCNLQWTNEGCSTTIGNDTMEAWGACNDPQSTIESCTYITATVTKDTAHQCTGGKYCNLQWTNATCSTGIGDETTDAWGACNDPQSTIESCSYTSVNYQTDIKCPNQYYCNLIWRNESCQGISDETTTAWGRCSFPTEYKTTCLN